MLLRDVPLISVSDLSHSYSAKPVFSGLSFEVSPSDICLITGPSGIGKTTLLSLVGAILPPQAGNITYNPVLIPREHGFGYAFIDGPFFENLSVRENVLLLQSFSDAPIESSFVDELLHYFEISTLQSMPLISLSAGQRERVNFVRALVHKPKVLILDEPGANLDARLFEKLLLSIRNLQKEQQTAFVIVSHDSRFLDIASMRIEFSENSTPTVIY